MSDVVRWARRSRGRAALTPTRPARLRQPRPHRSGARPHRRPPGVPDPPRPVAMLGRWPRRARSPASSSSRDGRATGWRRTTSPGTGTSRAGCGVAPCSTSPAARGTAAGSWPPPGPPPSPVSTSRPTPSPWPATARPSRTSSSSTATSPRSGRPTASRSSRASRRSSTSPTRGRPWPTCGGCWPRGGRSSSPRRTGGSPRPRRHVARRAEQRVPHPRVHAVGAGHVARRRRVLGRPHGPGATAPAHPPPPRVLRLGPGLRPEAARQRRAPAPPAHDDGPVLRPDRPLIGVRVPTSSRRAP